MSALKTNLAAIVEEEYGGNMTAAVIDDEVDTRDLIPTETWSEVRAQVMDESVDLWTKLDGAVEEYRDSSGDAELYLRDWDEIKAKVQEEDGLSEQEEATLRRADETMHRGLSPLLLLAEHLEGSGINIHYHNHLPPDEDLSRYDIVFLDYQFEREESHGEVAEQVLKAIMRVAASSNREVPAQTILMSKNLRQEQAEVWENLSTRGGYLRFNYTFLEKNLLQTTPDTLFIRVLDLINRRSVSASYYREIKSIQDAVVNAAQRATNTLFGVSPTEIGRFIPILEKEGASTADVLLALYSELLQQQVAKDGQVKSSFNALDVSVSQLPDHLGVLPSRRFLHELMAGCVFSATVDEMDPVRFGDVYKPNPNQDVYELVLTQECDLSVRSGAAPTASDILMLTGKVVTAIPQNTKTNFIYQPFDAPGSSHPRWIEWNLSGLKVRRFRGLQVNLRMRRAFRMRFAEADRLQQEVASRLTRVATRRFPHASQVLPCTVRIREDESISGLEITVIRGKYGDAVPRAQVTELAFGPCIDALLFHAESLGLSMSDALALRMVQCRNDFKKKLEAARIRLLEDGNRLFLSPLNATPLPQGIKDFLA